MPPIIGRSTEGRDVRINVDRLIETRAIVMSRSGGGKSFALRRLLEQTHGHVQQIVIDVEAEFFTLREKFDYVLAGGAEGDCPADTRSAAMLARKLLELRVSAIIDIYELKSHERVRFVKLFLESMIESPKSLWHPCLIVIDEAHLFCLDDQTEILTDAGFKRWDQISVGDPVVNYDLESKTYAIAPIERVIMRPYDGPMFRIKSDGIDALMTPEHRAVIERTQRGVGRFQIYPPSFCEADKLPSHFCVPIGGSPCGIGVPDLSEDMCRLLGWIITDGHYTGGSSKTYLGVEQSTATIKGGVPMVPHLRSLLGRLGELSEYPRAARQTTTDGRVKRHAASVCFYLGVVLSAAVLRWLGKDIHRIPRSILNGASREQLQALWDALLEGDGTRHKNGNWAQFYAGKNEALADDFQELCLKLGRSSVKKFVKQNGQWTVMISIRSRHWIRHSTQETYAGITWDVTVPTGAFVARRNGKVFVTGNCPESAKCESTQAVVDLMTRGRKRGFAGILATQRASSLSKDASAQAVNKLIGGFSQDIDVERAAKDLGFFKRESRAELQTLSPGSFFAVGPALCENVTELKVGPVVTTHPRAGQRAMAPPPPREAVKKVLASLADLPAEAEKELQTIEDLKARVKTLEAEARKATPAADMLALKAQHAEVVRRYQTAAKRAVEMLANVPQAIEATREFIAPIAGEDAPTGTADDRIPRPVVDALRKRVSSESDTDFINRKITNASNGHKRESADTSADARILRALAMLHRPATKRQLGVLAGVNPKKSTWRASMASLKQSGMIYLSGDGIELTGAGRAASNHLPPISADERVAMWREKFDASANRIFSALLTRHGEPWERQELGEYAKIDPNLSTWRAAMAQLRAAGFLIEDSRGFSLDRDLLEG